MTSFPQSRLENGLLEPVIRKIRAVFVRYPQGKEVVLYGLCAKGTYKTVLILT